MSKDIWHSADERPEPFKTFVFKTDKGNTCSDMLSTNSDWNPILLPEFYSMDDFDKAERITKWCYLDDLMALETENKDLSDKIGKLESELDRTRKALDVANAVIMNYAKEKLEQKESVFVHNKIEFPEYNDNLLEEFDKQFFENGQDDDLTETALEQKEE